MKAAAVRRVSKPWGYELIWAQTDRYAGKILHIEKNEALSLQYHLRKDETIYLFAGSLALEVAEPDGTLCYLELRPGDSFHIRPRLRHRMTALQSCDVLEVSTAELDDVVRLEDRYGRVQTERS